MYRWERIDKGGIKKGDWGKGIDGVGGLWCSKRLPTRSFYNCPIPPRGTTKVKHYKSKTTTKVKYYKSKTTTKVKH